MPNGEPMKHSLLSSAIIASTLVGCGSDSDTATFSLNLTDAPLAEIAALNLHVNSIELKKSSDTFTFEVNETINLLELQGSTSLNLIEQAELPAGQYQYIRVDVDTEQSELLVGDASFTLDIPSAAQSGLKLVSPFTLSANGNANFTLDFDVAKSLSLSAQGYKLRPTIRIVDNSEIGHISGTVAAELSNCESTLSVYAFEGIEAVFEEQSETGGPVTSALVSYNTETQTNEFELGFLEAGDYRLDLVCGDDDPLSIDELASIQNITVNVEASTTADAVFEVSIVEVEL